MKFDVSKTIADRWPDLEWNPHMVRMADAAYEHRLLGITGGPCTSKTTFLAAYALSVFEHSLADTQVLWFCTSLQDSHMRGFGAMSRLFQEAPGSGVISHSRAQVLPCGQAAKGAGIYFVPNSTAEQWSDMVHLRCDCEHLLVIADDANVLHRNLAASIVLKNLERTHFQAIVAGNPGSRHDLHGKFCQPRHGWESIGLDDKEWPTIMGHCIHLDSLPIVEGYSGLMTQEKLDMFRNLHGEDSPEYCRFVRGFWAPAQEAPKTQP